MTSLLYKKTVRNPLQFIREFTKVAGYQINIQNGIIIPCGRDEQPEKKVKNTIPCTVASKRKKVNKRSPRVVSSKLENIIQRN